MVTSIIGSIDLGDASGLLRALIGPTAPLRAKAGDLFKSGPVLVAGRNKL